MLKETVAARPRLWDRLKGFSHCAGCHHPTIAGLICRVVEEMEIEGNVICLTGVGCGFPNFTGFEFDGGCVPHGRAPDVATGIKRALLGRPIVLAVMGDGDCIAIGAESLINTAGRAEKVTVVMVNNGNYGTTGGQLAPTTLMEQVTTTTPGGRRPDTGYPIHVPELLATIKGVAYAARGSVNSPPNYQRAKQYLKKALQKQIDGVGFSFVELLSACPPDWHMTPLESLKWIEERMIPEFPLGEYKDVERIG